MTKKRSTQIIARITVICGLLLIACALAGITITIISLLGMCIYEISQFVISI